MVILDVYAAAKFLGKTPAALRNGYKRWGIPHFRLGGQIRFEQLTLEKWIAEQSVDLAIKIPKRVPRNLTGCRGKSGKIEK
jgi:hypothetical protein